MLHVYFVFIQIKSLSFKKLIIMQKKNRTNEIYKTTLYVLRTYMNEIIYRTKFI